MLGLDDVFELRARVHEYGGNGDMEARLLLECLAVVHTEILNRYVADSNRYYSSAVARHRFVAMDLRMEKEIDTSLAKLLDIATNPYRAQAILNPELPQHYVEFLLHTLDLCEHHTLGSTSHESTTDSDTRKDGGPADGTSAKPASALSPELSSALTSWSDAAGAATVDAAPRLHRLVVTDIGRRLQTANGEIHVLDCLSEDGRDVRVALRHSLLGVAEQVWVGASIHITEARALDDERIVTTAESVCVVEPDVLVDVTDVAECFQQRSVEPLLSLLRKFTRSSASEAVVTGSIINSCFDDILLHPDKEFEDMFRDACVAKPLSSIAALSAEQRILVKETVRDHVQRLREVMKRVSYDRAVVEPSFISPVFGLQGRLDVMLEHDDHPLHKTIIELKSGSAPGMAAAGGFGTPRSRVWRNHEAQIACYQLLLQSAYPGRYGASEILYSKTDEEPLRNVDVSPSMLQEVLLCRNAIIRMEHEIRSKNFSAIRKACEPIPSLPSFMTKSQEEVRAIFATDDQDMLLYAQAFLYLMLRENHEQRVGGSRSGTGFAGLWTSTLAEKRQRHAVLSGLRLHTAPAVDDDSTLTFARSAADDTAAVFRVGDIVVVYPVDPLGGRAVYHGLQRKGSIRAIDGEHVVVRLRGQQPVIAPGEELLDWQCEADYMESSASATLATFMTFFRSSERTRNLILGRIPPALREPHGTSPVPAPAVERGTADTAPPPANGSGIDTEEELNAHQRELLEKALRADDYFLLQGPPGTGKTSVMLRALVRNLRENLGETVLIAAYTNRAVDEICRMLKRTLPQAEYVRMGRHENTEHPDILFQTLVRDKGLDEAERHLRNARVVVATVTFINSNPELFDVCRFTTAIVDEAAQILEPHLVGMISRMNRFILIGDEKQLPPVLGMNERSRTVSNERLDAMGIGDLQVSLFDRLLRCCMRNGWTHAYGMLTHQGRMHEEIGRIASELFYGGRLVSLTSRQHDNLPVVAGRVRRGSGGLLPEHQAREILRHRCVYIPTPRSNSKNVNPAEARLCAALSTLFFEASRDAEEWNDMRLGIITPFRAQIQEIRTALPPRLRTSVTIDTVERFQGSERDVIILSPVVSSAAALSAIQSLTHEDDAVIDRKLNVALTRARERFILLGDEDTLRTLPQYAALIDHITRTGIRIADGNSIM